MDDFRHSPPIDMTIHRCWFCGGFYAVENWCEGHRDADCPYCAYRKRQERCDYAAQLQRRISALKGALTRAKNGAAR